MMRRSSIALMLLAFVLAAGCRDKTTEKAAQPSPTPAAGATIAPPSPGPSAGPAVKATVPSTIEDRLRRPLTDKEIMALPPETRDMILRAQGKPVPTPTKKR